MRRPLTAKSTFILSLLIISLAPVGSFSQEALTRRPFANKLIFSETPEIGVKWHGGIRMNDFLVWDGYWNINNWLTADLLLERLNNLKFDSNATLVTDRFSVLTLKSRPLNFNLKGNPCKIAAGIKMYNSTYITDIKNNPLLNDSLIDKSTVLFITESYMLKDKHCFNLFTSVSFRDIGDPTYYMVPGYCFLFAKHWSFSVEYYLTNTIYLPIKILQMAISANNWSLENFSRDYYSFMIYGFQYTGDHLRIDLNLASPASFSGPFFPVVGVGWNF
jgi:hypothetical protein